MKIGGAETQTDADTDEADEKAVGFSA